MLEFHFSKLHTSSLCISPQLSPILLANEALHTFLSLTLILKEM